MPSATPLGGVQGRQACVVAYDDRNGDGARSPSERFVAGVTVRLTHIVSGAFVTWTTDGANDPDFCWNGLTDGSYTLEITELPLGIIGSGIAEHGFDVPMAEASITFDFGVRSADAPTAVPTEPATSTPTPPPTPRPTPTALPTVDGPSGTVCAIVYSDVNANGFDDPGEPLIADIMLTIEDEARRPSRTLLSRSDDGLCVPLPAGVYYVTVADVPDHVSTTPREEVVLLTAGDVRNVRFGWHSQFTADGTRILLPFSVRQVRSSP